MSKVNLDALIPREDFAIHTIQQSKQSNIDKITLQHLIGKESYFSLTHLLKKPDFQRETNEWDIKRIAELIECFIERSFIPSLILWENSQNRNIYVIDGAHRLSAIMAYIHDDYGDGEMSRKFYSNKIPQAELLLAENTRIYVNKKIGSFKTIMEENGAKADNIKQAAFKVQVIEGDVKKAEESFFKINQQGVTLSSTEKALCKSREFPSCIATRAIIKGGQGTQYWKSFEPTNQINIKDIAEQLNTILFKPPYDESSKTVTQQPLGGNITIGTPLVFEMMKVIRSFYFSKKEEKDLSNGGDTLQYLIYARKIIWKMLSEEPGSLGLYPTVYFYNSVGKHIQSAFLGMVQLLCEKEHDDIFLIKFTTARARLENFLMNHKVLLTQINRTNGSLDKSFKHMKGFFYNLVNLFNQELSDEEILSKIKEVYKYLNENENDTDLPKAKKSELTILLSNKEEMLGEPTCKICNGYLHHLSKSKDHIKDLKFGGHSGLSNLQTTHFYCNNSKDKLVEIGFYKNKF